VRQPPTTRQFKTAAGHYWLMEDAEGERSIHVQHSAGASIDIDDAGTVTLTDAAGASVTLDAEGASLRIEDANGNRLTLDQVIVKGTQIQLGGEGGEPLIKGQSFLSLFMTHVHTSSPTGGPTTPPIPQGELSTLSTKVRSA